MQEKIPTWSIVTFILSLIVTFSSLLYANNSRISERELDINTIKMDKFEITDRDHEKRITIMETKIDTILEGIKNINKKMDEQKGK